MYLFPYNDTFKILENYPAWTYYPVSRLTVIIRVLDLYSDIFSWNGTIPNGDLRLLSLSIQVIFMAILQLIEKKIVAPQL